MAYNFTARLKIPIPDENDVPDVPVAFRDRAVILDKLAPIDVGPLSSEPPSTSGSPGVTGRFFVVMDQPPGAGAPVSPRLDVDTGTGYFTVGPTPVDQAPGVASARTLGGGPNQACAGDDPRLVGGAQATGDVTGAYPGPLTVVSINGQALRNVVGSYQPQAHGSTHRPGSSDAVTGLTDASMAAANVDGAAGTASMRTLGQGAQQAMPGNDPRVSVGRVNVPGDLIFSAAGARAGCLLCDGSAVSRNTYAALFAAIGTSYGAGDGGATFNVPDYRGRSIVGAGAGAGLTARALGAKGGEETHLTVIGEVPAHAHVVSDPGHAHGVSDPGHAHNGNGYSLVGSQAGVALASWAPQAGHTPSIITNGPVALVSTDARGTGIGIQGSGTGIGIQNAGGGVAHNNMQPYGTANVFIVY